KEIQKTEYGTTEEGKIRHPYRAGDFHLAEAKVDWEISLMVYKRFEYLLSQDQGNTSDEKEVATIHSILEIIKVGMKERYESCTEQMEELHQKGIITGRELSTFRNEFNRFYGFEYWD